MRSLTRLRLTIGCHRRPSPSAVTVGRHRRPSPSALVSRGSGACSPVFPRLNQRASCTSEVRGCWCPRAPMSSAHTEWRFNRWAVVLCCSRVRRTAPQALFIAAEDDELIRVSHAHSLLENYGALKSSVVRSAPLPWSARAQWRASPKTSASSLARPTRGLVQLSSCQRCAAPPVRTAAACVTVHALTHGGIAIAVIHRPLAVPCQPRC